MKVFYNHIKNFATVHYQIRFPSKFQKPKQKLRRIHESCVK